MIGYVSQLCHAIAVSLMCANDNTSLCEYTGDSFRDLTRIARINDKMWAELFLWNKENLIAEIDQFSASLEGLVDGFQGMLIWISYHVFGLVVLAVIAAAGVVIGRSILRKKRKESRKEGQDQ